MIGLTCIVIRLLFLRRNGQSEWIEIVSIHNANTEHFTLHLLVKDAIFAFKWKQFAFKWKQWWSLLHLILALLDIIITKERCFFIHPVLVRSPLVCIIRVCVSIKACSCQLPVQCDKL